ncbi:MAG: helix-turn-helix domain-containing protein [Bacteroidota bacterium]
MLFLEQKLMVGLWDIVIMLGVLHGLIHSAMLLKKPISNRKANLFLIIFLLTFSMSMLYMGLESIGLRTYLSIYNFLPFYCSAAIAPSFYLFVLFLINPDRRFSRRDMLFYLPLIIQWSVQLIGVGVFWVDESILMKNDRLMVRIYDSIDLFVLCYSILFVLLAFLKLKAYQQAQLENYAAMDKDSLDWLRRSVVGLFVIWGLFASATLLEQFVIPPSLQLFYPLILGMSVFIYWIGYSTHRYDPGSKTLFSQKEGKEPRKFSSKTKAYFDEVVRLMEQEKLYLNHELNLKGLADRLGISSNYASQILNHHSGKNFFEFVNTYRVEEVKERLNDEAYSHLSLLGIAMECGFNSKSTFNLSFKKLTGHPPSYFKKADF